MAQTDPQTALTVVDSSYTPAALGMVRPLVDPMAAQAAIAEYEALKAAIIRPGDVQKIQGRDFLKKSFWRRVATCFGLSLELVSETRGHDEKGGLFYSVIYRAVAPNGRVMTADGYCSQSEQGRGGWPEHNVRATAHTRAKNRAISDLVGGGEVSADELTEYVEADPAPATPSQASPNRPQPAKTTAVTAAARHTSAGTDLWAEVRELATQLMLSDEERGDLFKRHKKDRAAILTELRERYAAEQGADATGIVAAEEDMDLANAFPHAGVH